MQIFKWLVASLIAMLSFTVYAAEDRMFFPDKQTCESALASGNSLAYTPALKRPAPQAWKRDALQKDTCVQMESAQGMQWVVLAKGSPMAQNPSSSSWHHADCTNWTNWRPTGLSSPVASSTPGVVQGQHGNTILQTACDAKCEAKKVCDQQVGTLGQMNAQGEWLCELPGQKVRLIQPVEVNGTVVYRPFGGWTDPGMQVPGAVPQVSVGRPNIGVSAPVCGPACQPQPAAQLRSESPAKFCGIQTNNGDLLVIRDQGGMMQLVLNPVIRPDGTPDFSNRPRAWTFDKVQMSRFAGNCDAAQRDIEGPGWPHVVKALGLPNACLPARRQGGVIYN